MTPPFPDWVWSVGEEGSDPIVLRDGAPWRHDQFAQSGHRDRMEEDLQSIADLGVEIVRYGTPWRLAEPEPGQYDWSLWDRAFAACDAAGLTPVVEFLHFGLPDHHVGFVDGSWVEGFCRYVDAFIERYPEPRWFTPVNEPGVTARFSARFGMWNDRAATKQAHMAALANVVLANLEAMARLRADRNAWWVGAEGFDMPIAVDASATENAAAIRASVWLVWDLHFGVAPLPSAAPSLDLIDDRVRDRIASLTINDDLVAGLDVYPVSLAPVGGTADWSIADRLDLIDTEMRRWHDRYDVPYWVAETSNLTLPVARQSDWLDGLSSVLAAQRADGRPARGLCWYSRGDQFDWQTALTEPTGAVTEVGVFDVNRVARPVAERFREVVEAGPPKP